MLECGNRWIWHESPRMFKINSKIIIDFKSNVNVPCSIIIYPNFRIFPVIRKKKFNFCFKSSINKNNMQSSRGHPMDVGDKLNMGFTGIWYPADINYMDLCVCPLDFQIRASINYTGREYPVDIQGHSDNFWTRSESPLDDVCCLGSTFNKYVLYWWYLHFSNSFLKYSFCWFSKNSRRIVIVLAIVYINQRG